MGSVEDCQAAVVERRRPNPSLLVLDGVLGTGEVRALVDLVERTELLDQDLGKGWFSRRQRGDVDEPAMVDRLWSCLEGLLPDPADWFPPGRPAPTLDRPIDAWTWEGLNPRCRFYRYGLGAEFSTHVDEPWQPSPNRRTLLTVLVYLPTARCRGGETLVAEEVVEVVPGRVVLFDHRIPHASKPVTKGTKLVLRTDLLARCEPAAP